MEKKVSRRIMLDPRIIFDEEFENSWNKFKTVYFSAPLDIPELARSYSDSEAQGFEICMEFPSYQEPTVDNVYVTVSFYKTEGDVTSDYDTEDGHLSDIFIQDLIDLYRQKTLTENIEKFGGTKNGEK